MQIDIVSSHSILRQIPWDKMKEIETLMHGNLRTFRNSFFRGQIEIRKSVDPKTAGVVANRFLLFDAKHADESERILYCILVYAPNRFWRLTEERVCCFVIRLFPISDSRAYEITVAAMEWILCRSRRAPTAASLLRHRMESGLQLAYDVYTRTDCRESYFFSSKALRNDENNNSLRYSSLSPPIARLRFG